MALFAIFIQSIVRQTYIIYAFMFGCILSGRIFNYLLTDELITSIIVAMVAEAIVVGLSLWRLMLLNKQLN